MMIGIEISNILISYLNKERNDFTYKKTLLYVLIILGCLGADYYLTSNFNAVIKGLIVGLYFAGFIIFLIFGVKYLILYILKIYFYFANTSSVKNISNYGFDIARKRETTHINWSEIKDYKLNNRISKLTLYTNKPIKIKDSADFYYLLLKNIPKEINSQNSLRITDFFSSLKSCSICGHFAVENKTCLNCTCRIYEPKSGQTESDYIIENQLDIFATWDRAEKFNNFKTEEQGFLVDDLWKPSVTKREVLEYSEKECWDK